MTRRILAWGLLWCVLTSLPAWAQNTGPSGGGSITVTENDGSPSVSSVNSISFTNGTVTDNGSGSVSVTISGTGAPTDAPYITSTAVSGLSAEVPLSALSTGCLSVTTTTGALNSRTLTGTANEISVANGDCSGTPTFSLPAAIDLGGKTSFEIPNAAAPTTNVFGQIAGDNNAWAASRGTLQIYDGTANTLAVNVLASDTPGNGECPKWNTGGTITWETCSGGSGTVTNTGGNLTTNAVVLGAGTVDTKVSTGITTNGTAQLVLGVNATTLGSLKLFGNTSGDATISPSAAAGTATAITIPAQTGTLVVGALGSTANAIPKTSGTGGSLLQASGVTVDSSNNVTIPGNLTVQGGGTVTIFDLLEGAAPGANGTASHHNLYINSTGSVLETHENGGSVKTYVYQGGDIGAGTATTASANDNDTSIATTAYVQTELTAYASDSVTLTNKTFDAEGTGNVLTVPWESYYSAAGCNNTTAGPVWNLPASNPAVAACDTGTNVQTAYMGFNDTTDQRFEGSFRLPSGHTGNIDVIVRYKAASATSGAMGWCFQMVRVATGSTSDPAYPAQASGNCVSDTVPGTAGQEDEATITGATCTSCVAGDMIYWALSRDANGGAVTDSATGDGRVIGFTVRTRRAL